MHHAAPTACMRVTVLNGEMRDSSTACHGRQRLLLIVDASIRIAENRHSTTTTTTTTTTARPTKGRKTIYQNYKHEHKHIQAKTLLIYQSYTSLVIFRSCLGILKNHFVPNQPSGEDPHSIQCHLEDANMR